MNLPIFIAKRYLFSKKKKSVINLISFISMFGIGVGAMALIIVLSAFNGINNLVESLYSSFDAEIRIEATNAKTFTDNQELRNKILSIEEIQSLGVSLEETVLIKYKDSQAFAVIKGVDSSFVSIKGSLSTHLVSILDFVLKAPSKPYIVLSNGSSPMFVFGVRGLSVRCKMVPPRRSLSETL